MMKKLFWCLLIINSFIFLSILNDRTKESNEEKIIYDYSDVFDDEYEKELKKYMARFIDLSGIDLAIATYDTPEEENIVSTKLYLNDEFGEGFNKSRITIYIYTYNNQMFIDCDADNYYDNASLLVFEARCIDKYNYKSYSVINMISMINEWILYYTVKNFIIFIVIIVLSMIFTKLILDRIKSKYLIPMKNNADDYYKFATVNFVNNDENNIKN